MFFNLIYTVSAVDAGLSALRTVTLTTPVIPRYVVYSILMFMFVYWHVLICRGPSCVMFIYSMFIYRHTYAM